MAFQTPQTDGLNRKYLQLQDLRRLQTLSFACRRAVEGQYSGQHATRQRGQSVEFRDYRQYMPGDELSNVDWKVYGRSDKLFIKIFEHQADLTAHLLVDASASMAFRGISRQQMLPPIDRRRMRGRLDRSLPLSKFDYACFLAAGIGFLIVKQKDRVSFSVSRNGLRGHLPPGSSAVHLTGILQSMEKIDPKGEARLAESIRALAGKSRRRDLLIVFSDLLDASDEVMNAMSMWIHRGGEAILFHVMHADELKLPAIENGLFVDSETSDRIRLDVEDIRRDYDARMQTFLDGWSQASKGNGIDYMLASTGIPYHEILYRYLTHRAAIR